MAPTSSLKERLAKLQSKSRKPARNGISSSPTKSPRKIKKSFFNPDNAIESETSLISTANIDDINDLPYLQFPDIDKNEELNKLTILKAANRLSKKYMLPQIGVGANGIGLLSQNSKTFKISKKYPNILIQDQLYAIFKGQETKIDKIISELIDDSKLRVLNMNFENFNFSVLIITDEFTKIIKNSFKDSEIKIRDQYIELLNNDPTITQILSDDLINCNLNHSLLISKGLICMSSSTEYTSNPIYNITLPHLGGLLRVVQNAVKWITSTTGNTREHMIMAATLRDKWFKTYVPPKNSNSNYKNDNSFNREYYTTDRVGVVKPKSELSGPGLNIVKFRGIGLDWVLALMLGTGCLESYESPAGLVYKSTGKSL